MVESRMGRAREVGRSEVVAAVVVAVVVALTVAAALVAAAAAAVVVAIEAVAIVVRRVGASVETETAVRGVAVKRQRRGAVQRGCCEQQRESR